MQLLSCIQGVALNKMDGQIRLRRGLEVVLHMFIWKDAVKVGQLSVTAKDVRVLDSFLGSGIRGED